MALTEAQDKVLNLICSTRGGIDITDLMDHSELPYVDVMNVVHQLIAKGYRVAGLMSGGGWQPDPRYNGWYKRLYLSPSDRRYNDLIKTNANI